MATTGRSLTGNFVVSELCVCVCDCESESEYESGCEECRKMRVRGLRDPGNSPIQLPTIGDNPRLCLFLLRLMEARWSIVEEKSDLDPNRRRRCSILAFGL